MKGSILEYAKKELPQAEKVKRDPKAQEEVKDLKSAYDRYSGMDKSSLMQELKKNIQQSKRNGTFNSNQLNDMINRLSPVLSEQQIDDMREMLKQFEK